MPREPVINVLLAGGSQQARSALAFGLGRHADIRVTGSVEDGDRAIDLVQTLPVDVVVFVPRRPEDGELIAAMLRAHPSAHVVVVIPDDALLAATEKFIAAGALSILGGEDSAKELHEAVRRAAAEQLRPGPLQGMEMAPLDLYFESSRYSAKDIAEIISILSDVYRSIGGDRLVIEGTTLLLPAAVPQPVGV